MPLARWSQRFARPTAAATALVALGFVAAGCGGDGDNAAGAKADGPIKVGVLLPYTGPFGLYGKPMEAALRQRLTEAGNKAGARGVELVFEDEATDPKVAVSKVTKLLDQDHVSAVVCCATGAATLAVAPILAERKVPQLGPIPNPSGLSKYATAAVAAPTAGHDAEALGRYTATTLGYKTAAIVASDFAYGQEVAANFTKGFTSKGGTVTSSTFAPLGTQDFGAYLTKVGHPDVVFGGFAGADAIGFVKQYRKFGVKAPLIGHGPLVTELVLNAIGPDGVGVGAGFYYSSQLENAENDAFKAAMQATPKFVPSHFTAGAWATGSVLLDAIERAGSNATDGEALASAIRATDIPAPWGELRFDAKTGYAIAPTYYYEVTHDGGAMQHHVDGEIPGGVMSFDEWVVQLAIGLSFGLLLFLLASGFTLTFGLARFLNLSHGAVFLVAAYVATVVGGPGWRFALGLAAAGLTGVVLSLATYAMARTRWRRFGSDELSQVLLTFGMLLVFAEVARGSWDGLPRALDPPDVLAGSWAIGDVSFPVYRAFMGGAALLLGLGLWWLQERTTFGALVRAGVDDREMLEGSGVSPRALFTAVFALGGLLAGLAAGLGAPVIGASMGQEFSILVLAFVVVVLGGSGSLLGAFVASMAVGVADALGKALIPTFAEFTMMGLVVLVLAWRPDGLFGMAER